LVVAGAALPLFPASMASLKTVSYIPSWEPGSNSLLDFLFFYLRSLWSGFLFRALNSSTSTSSHLGHHRLTIFFLSSFDPARVSRHFCQLSPCPLLKTEARGLPSSRFPIAHSELGLRKILGPDNLGLWGVSPPSGLFSAGLPTS